MQLEYDSGAKGGTAQYNGNIATMEWNTHVNGTCNTRQLYRFSYDYANRLTAANHLTWSGSAWATPSPLRYTESGISYDLNGNLKTYTRNGLVSGTATFGVIDQLIYSYLDPARPDRLTHMADAGSATKGFVFAGSVPAYGYDANGNMTQDNHKGFSFQYNYLNLPIVMTKGTNVITITYTADGEKLTKTLTGGTTKNYVGGIEYAGASVEAIYHSEGRCTPNGATAFHYEYSLKDHLGNVRINFRASGTTIVFLEENHYYPFGLQMEGISTPAVTQNGYKYNSKELNNDFGLGLYDYGARWYDASVGRWWSVDPLAAGTLAHSVYHYGFNNPIAFIDPDGRSSEPPGGGLIGRINGKISEYNNQQNQQYNDWLDRTTRRASLGSYGSSYSSPTGMMPTAEGQESEADKWQPLYKSDLERYAQLTGVCTNCTSNDLGTLFERIFALYMRDSPAGRLSNFRAGLLYRGLSDRNTKPDFISDANYIRLKGRLLPAVEEIDGGTWYELKAKYGDLYDSSSAYQIRGHIDNLAALMAPIRATRPGFMPGLYIITTADVNVSSVIFDHANFMGIQLMHSKAQFSIIDGQYEFKF